MQKAFEIFELTKSYKDFTLGPINLDLNQGSVMGFVGHNGAGKSTLLLSLAGLLRSDSGNFKIFNEQIDINKGAWKNEIAYVGEANAFFGMWKARENFNFLAKFFSKWDNNYKNELIKRLEFDENKKIQALSAGNKAKYQIISALARRPKLLLLDEPANGLDPIAREEFINLLFEFMESGENSIIYSTHIITEIARLADEFTFIANGKIVHKQIKEDMLESWREITINSEIRIGAIPACERMEHSSGITRIISNDCQKTKEYLLSNQIEIAEEFPLNIEEISINILKRNKK